MQAILEAAGRKVHRYISPHLLRFNERIVLSGTEISDDYLFSLLEECRLADQKIGSDVSFFEGVTAAAFLGFSRVPADVLLLEVGLGGRLDATNVIERPQASVLTSISYDHQNVLGNSLEQIAYEKAHIIKQNSSCIVGLQTYGVHEVIERYAYGMNASVMRFGREFVAEIVDEGRWHYRSDLLDIELPTPALPGLHQYVNAATAIATLTKCFSLKEEVFRLGVANAKWLGRLSQITRGALFKILPAGTELWVDSAHNESGAQALADWLASQEKVSTCLIFNMTKNRDVNKFLDKFEGLLDKIMCTNIYSEPLSYRSDVAKSLIQSEALKNIASNTDTLEEACQLIASEQGKYKRVLIAGSLFLISDFLSGNDYIKKLHAL
jgi:dihydrofolate synthase/folylpolyglutamate synthase